jgi:hypothetical protein
MASVQQVLDKLAAGKITLADAVADFEGRRWPARARTSVGRAFGVEDDPVPTGNDWATVEADSRLTTAQYTALAKARRR